MKLLFILHQYLPRHVTGTEQYARSLALGLRERVTSDGEWLWHVYRDIGLAAERAVSRYHRATIHTLVPWLVRPVEELARGADVRLIDDSTIAVVPHTNTKTQGESEAHGDSDDADQSRDLAVWRARRLGLPVILGSATPSLESLWNAGRGRYHHLELPERTGADTKPIMS